MRCRQSALKKNAAQISQWKGGFTYFTIVGFLELLTPSMELATDLSSTSRLSELLFDNKAALYLKRRKNTQTLGGPFFIFDV